MVTTPWDALPVPSSVAGSHAAGRGALREGARHDKPPRLGEANITACGASQGPEDSVRSV